MKGRGGRLGITLVAAALAVAVGSPRAHAQIIVGANGGSNLIPFGTIGGAGAQLGPYQQVYASTAFPGLLEITGIAFESSAASATGAYTVTGTLGLAVSNTITPASPGTTYIATTNVFTGTQATSILANGTFDLVFGITPFVYDPALGNLVLGVTTTAATSQGDVEFAFDPNSPVMGRTINSAPAEAFANSGLRTEFLVRQITPGVPEPSALSMLGAIGIAGSALLARRRRP